MIPFNTCISPGNWYVITWPPDMLPLGKTPVTTWLVTCLISISCHAISWHPAWSTRLVIITLRESCLVILNGTKCHTEQSATSPMVGATSWICRAIPVMSSYSRNLIIVISHKKGQLVWVWEEVMDAGMISRLWLGNMAHGYSYVPL